MCRPGQMQLMKKGFALAVTMSVMVLMLVLGFGLMNLAVYSQLQATKESRTIQARCAADAGLTKAMYEMNQKLRVTPWDDDTLPTVTDAPLPECLTSTLSYSVTKNDSGIYSIVSTGRCGPATRVVSASLAMTGPPYAILVANLLYMKNNGVITGSCGTLSADGSSFSIAKGTITGDAFVGVGGDPTSITCTVNGDKYALTAPITLTLPTVPSEALSAGPNTNWTTPNNASIGSPWTTTYLRYTGLTINGTLSVNGDVVMYVNGNLSDVGSGINVNNNSTLKLYIAGDFGPGGNGVDLASTTGDPSVLRIYGVKTSKQDFTLGKNKATTVGCIYAPNADVTIGKNKALFIGQIIANSFSAKNSADISYDQRVADSYGVTDPLTEFAVKTWKE